MKHFYVCYYDNLSLINNSIIKFEPQLLKGIEGKFLQHHIRKLFTSNNSHEIQFCTCKKRPLNVKNCNYIMKTGYGQCKVKLLLDIS